MDGGSLERSLDRIEAALSRITAAAQEPGRESGPSSSDISGAADLAARHELLKRSVTRSIAALDALISGDDG